MSLPALVLAVSFALARASVGGEGDSRADDCIVCHGEEGRQAAGLVHERAGISCVACHGGTPGATDAKTAHGSELRTLTDPRAAVDSCGGCHSDVQTMRVYGLRTDQLSLYWTSIHGQRLAESGDKNVATCVSCHGSHEVRSTKDPLSSSHPLQQPQTCGRCHSDRKLMGAYGVDADPVELFKSSVHGRALLEDGHPAAPTCTDCHGSHGATPPRVTEIDMVCGRCHATVQSFFEESPHVVGATSSAPVQCTSCHGDHAIERPSQALFLGNEAGHCGSCHAAEDPARALALRLHEEVQALDATIDAADSKLASAGTRGLFLGEERSYLDEARELSVRARTLTHTLSTDALADIQNRARARVDQVQERLATKDRTFRDRRILTGLFFALSIAFAVVLLMISREIRGRWKEARPARGEGR